jgi:hypothetical protein
LQCNIVPCSLDPAAIQFIPPSPPPHCPRFCRLLPQGRHGHQDKITMQYAYGPLVRANFALVSHHLIAHRHAAFVCKRNSWCSARCLPALLKTNAALILVSLLHFERSTVVIRIFFSVFYLPAQGFLLLPSCDLDRKPAHSVSRGANRPKTRPLKRGSPSSKRPHLTGARLKARLTKTWYQFKGRE